MLSKAQTLQSLRPSRNIESKRRIGNKAIDKRSQKPSIKQEKKTKNSPKKFKKTLQSHEETCAVVDFLHQGREGHMERRRLSVSAVQINPGRRKTCLSF